MNNLSVKDCADGIEKLANPSSDGKFKIPPK